MDREEIESEIEKIFEKLKYDYPFASDQMLDSLHTRLETVQRDFDLETEEQACTFLVSRGFKIKKK